MIRAPKEWAVRPLGEVATLQRGFDLPVQSRRDGAIPIFAANGPVGVHDSSKVKGPGVVTGRSGTLGKVHFVGNDFWPLNTALWVKDFHGNDPRWVYWLLSHMRLEQFTRGAGVPTLNRNLVHVVEVAVPPLFEQKQIAAILDAADELRVKRRKSIEELDTLLQSTFLDMFGDPVTNPKGWEVSTLSQVCTEIQNGKSIRQSKTASGIAISRIETISDGNVNTNRVGYADLSLEDVREYLLRPGDILFSHINSTQHLCKCALFQKQHHPMIHGMNLLRLRPSDRVEPRYLLHLLRSPNYRATLMRHENRAVNQSSIAAGKLKPHPLPVPPMNMQERFAEVFDRVHDVRERLWRHLDGLDSLFSSLQSRAFNGEL